MSLCSKHANSLQPKRKNFERRPVIASQSLLGRGEERFVCSFRLNARGVPTDERECDDRKAVASQRRLRSTSSSTPFAGTRERVVPAHTRKTRKVDIGRMHNGAMSERKRRKLRIGRQIASGPGNAEQSECFANILSVCIKNVSDRLRQPLLHVRRGFLNGQRSGESSPVRSDPNKGKKNRWAESDRLVSGKRS